MADHCGATAGAGRLNGSLPGFFAWPGTFRRLVARYERHALNELSFGHLEYLLILLRWSMYGECLR